MLALFVPHGNNSNSANSSCGLVGWLCSARTNVLACIAHHCTMDIGNLPPINTKDNITVIGIEGSANKIGVGEKWVPFLLSFRMFTVHCQTCPRRDSIRKRAV